MVPRQDIVPAVLVALLRLCRRIDLDLGRGSAKGFVQSAFQPGPLVIEFVDGSRQFDEFRTERGICLADPEIIFNGPKTGIYNLQLVFKINDLRCHGQPVPLGIESIEVRPDNLAADRICHVARFDLEDGQAVYQFTRTDIYVYSI